MMKQNRLNWKTTTALGDKYLYLAIMRDMKNYCARGYCDVLIALIMFSNLPSSLVIRSYNALPASMRKDHIIIDWCTISSVKAAFEHFLKVLHEINHTYFSAKAYEEAISEFTQHLKQ